MKSKLFLSIEGFDGSGKTTLLKELEKEGFTSIITPLKDRSYIRPLFEKNSEAITRFLYYMGENIEVSKKINSLSDNVVCDRYFHSAIAYHSPLVPKNKINGVFESLKDYFIKPDFVIYLTCPEKILFNRILKREVIDYEKELNVKYLRKVLKAYTSLISNNWIVIDSSKNSIEQEIDIIKGVIYGS